MRKNPRTKMFHVLAAAIASSALASPSFAGSEWYKNDGTNQWTMYKYVDFSSQTRAGDASYPTYTFRPDRPNWYYDRLNLDNSTTEGVCFEVMLGPPEN